MTNYRQVKNSRKRGGNKKDGATGRGKRRNDAQDAAFEALGFQMSDWNKWSYTWPGNFPVIRLVPGTIASTPGWVAVHGDLRVPIGQARPAEIKERLDDLILQIMKREAELADLPPDWEPDEVGPEIDADLWMTRPRAAARQSTPAVRDLAAKHKVSLALADEIAQERGE